MLKVLLPTFALAGCMSGGCIDGLPPSVAPNGEMPTNTYAVVIGMEHSLFAGDCPGAGLDAERMYALMSKYAKNIIHLSDNNATHKNVKKSIEDGIANSGSGLFILFYSGHGGSEPFFDTGSEELDGQDEFLCLYDTYMRDNEIWSMISQSKGRVLFITDSCHSRTQFRTAKVTLAKAVPLGVTWNEDGPLNLQCWSGCPDNAYSYGAASGGQFTNALLRHYKEGISYDALWEKMEKDTTLKSYEIIQRTKMGKDFGSNQMFR